MNSLASFDSNRFRLGNLCKNKHNWLDTDYSLRYISDGSCIKCAKNRATQWHNTNIEKARKSVRDCHKRYPEKYKKIVKDWQQKNRDRLLAKLNEWNKSEEGKLKKRQYAQSSRRQELTAKNRERLREYGKVYYRRYIKTERGRIVCTKARIKRRALKLQNHSFQYSSKELTSHLQHFNNCCAYCGAIATSIDHVIPISKGGADVLGNLLPCCRPCNSSKGCKDVEQWYKSCPSYTTKRWRKILKVLGLTESTLGQLSLF